ncbi:hypothetical protein F5Y14DRAFT_465334 [Nemania sp. NC0429]|nr:hypothetical protein F5Y14DRAFT_465334 [Nemania sp. NC0429]
MDFADYFHSLPVEQQQILLDGPSIPPPPGVTPQLDNPPNMNATSYTWTNVSLTIATLAIVLRAYSRLFCTRKVFIEDFLAFAGYGLLIAYHYCIYQMINGVGLFVHQWDIRLKDLAGEVYWIHFSANFYAISILTLKVAILLEWNRIFSPYSINIWFTRTCYFLIALNTLFFSASVIASALSCHPYKRIWDRTIPGYCINTMILDIASSGFNVFSDITILLLPQRIIWSLNTTVKRKVGISFLFAIGLAAVIVGVLRLVATARYIVSTDVTYTISSVGIWCSSELLLAMLIFCIPAIPKIFDKKTRLGQLIASLRLSIASYSNSRRTEQGTGSARSINGPGFASPERGYGGIEDAGALKSPPASSNGEMSVAQYSTDGFHRHGSEEHCLTFYEESVVNDTIEIQPARGPQDILPHTR